MVAWIKEVDDAVREDVETVGIGETEGGGGGGAVAIEAVGVGAGEGVDAAVRGDFEDGVAGFVSDVEIAEGVGS